MINIKERIFIKKSKEQSNLEEFVRALFNTARCGEIEVQHTPVVTRIIIHTTTPGLIIGSGGDRIKEAAEMVKQKFKIENPQIDVQKIDNPDLDSNIIAQGIGAALESGMNFRRVGNQYVERVMDSGATGCEIVMSGVITGARGRTERFVAGYIKKSGNTAERFVQKGFTTARPKRGAIGVTVKIMQYNPELQVKQAIKKIDRLAKEKRAEIAKDAAEQKESQAHEQESKMPTGKVNEENKETPKQTETPVDVKEAQ